MSKTRHMQARMSQRGINQRMVELAVEYGVIENDKVVLNDKQLKVLIAVIDNLRKSAVKALDKGGLVVVRCPDSGDMITTYTVDSYRRQAS